MTTMSVFLCPGFPALLMIARRGGQVLAVVNTNEPASVIRGLARLMLPAAERGELYRHLRY